MQVTNSIKATLMRAFAAIPIWYTVGQVLLFLFLYEVYSPALSGRMARKLNLSETAGDNPWRRR